MSFSDQSKANWDLALRAMPGITAEFGPEEKARSIALNDLAQRKFLICSQCKCENKIPSPDLRMFLCNKCRKEIWVTAKTNYHKARLFFVRLAIMRLREKGICLTGNQTSKLLRVTTDTVNRIHKQIGIAVISKLPNDAVEAPSENSLPIFSRRTTQTPARKPPFEEEFAMQREHEEENLQLVSVNTSLPGMPELSELELRILEILSAIPLTFDELVERLQSGSNTLSGALTVLELRGLIQAQPGNKFARAKSLNIKNAGNDQRIKSITESFNYFVKDHFQGIGRKDTQLYANLFWLANDRKTWRKGTLRKLYATHPYISYKDILEFVTPLSFKIVPRFNTS